MKWNTFILLIIFLDCNCEWKMSKLAKSKFDHLSRKKTFTGNRLLVNRMNKYLAAIFCCSFSKLKKFSSEQSSLKGNPLCSSRELSPSVSWCRCAVHVAAGLIGRQMNVHWTDGLYLIFLRSAWRLGLPWSECFLTRFILFYFLVSKYRESSCYDGLYMWCFEFRMLTP